MRTYEVIARVLRDYNIDTTFGLLGTETAQLGAELHGLGTLFYPARHENQAVAMAAAYARVSDKVGVVINSRGPGLVNSLTAMAAAAKAKHHTLIITGDSACDIGVSTQKRRADWKHIDHKTLCSLIDVHYMKPESASEVLNTTRSALEYAATRGTVCLAVPHDWMGTEADLAPSTPVEQARSEEAAAPADQINLIAEFLEAEWAVSRPVILAGRGSVDAGAGQVLRRLGELTGSLLATTMQARSLFAGDPYCIGVCGESSTPLASELIADSDCLLVFGAALNDYTTYKRTLFRNARVIQIDDDADSLGVFVEPDLAVVGNAFTTALALVTELERRTHSAIGYRTPEIHERILADDVAATVRDQSLPGLIDPRMLMIELNRLLPRERIVALDGGNFMGRSLVFLDVEDPDDFVQLNSNWPSIGLGMGTAIGAAIARPDRTTVLSTGDAGLMMALGDLETAIRHRLPILIVVSNDQAWGSEVVFLKSQGLPVDVAQVPTSSFAAIATSMGGAGRMITALDDVRALEGEVDRVGRGPLVLDCRINVDVPEQG